MERSYPGSPVWLQNVHVGLFILADREKGGEFTSDDEEIVMQFGSQAVMAIASDCKHHDEDRERNCLKW